MARRFEMDDRRRQLADAVCALADERGLEGVSVREVAGKAGVSAGAVQRCFRDKDEMLSFTLHHIGERIMARAAHPGDLLTTATQVALLDDTQRGEARVWLTFVAQAAMDPALAKTLRASYADLLRVFTRLVSDSTAVGEAQLVAGTLLALIDGLTTHVLFGHVTPQAATRMLREHIRGLDGESVSPM